MTPPVRAAVLSCPNCAGLADRDALRCSYCQAQLKTAACAQCYALAFVGTKHCPECGTKLTDGLTQIDRGVRPPCPRCRVPMGSVLLGGTVLDECGTCGGLWIEQSVFEAICARKDLESTISELGKAGPQREPEAALPSPAAYIPCARCAKLMNRSNFARISGVIIDSCKAHGTWFDRDELHRIVEFIRKGGLDHARARERAQLDESRRKLEGERRNAEGPSGPGDSRWASDEGGDLLSTLFSAIHSLFR